MALKSVSGEDVRRRTRDVLARIEDSDPGITVSIGAYFQEEVRIADPKSIIRRADEAMYTAKAAGKNNCVIRE